MSVFRTRFLPIVALAFLCALPATAAENLPQVTEDGLHLVPDSRLAVVYADPAADLSVYDSVMLLDAYVAFKKNWEREQRSRSAAAFAVTSKDIERMKNGLATEFHAVFKRVLEEGGYPLVDEPADDVLLVRPAIINLDVAAPNTPHSGQSRIHTTSAGEMTLYLELFDSVTGDLIVKALDRKVDNPARQGFYTWSDTHANRAASERIIGGWAGILLDALNEAKFDNLGAGNAE